MPDTQMWYHTKVTILPTGLCFWEEEGIIRDGKEYAGSFAL